MSRLRKPAPDKWGLRMALIALIPSLVFVSVALSADIGGRYNVAGTNLDGSKYGGTADITIKGDTDCNIVWHWEGSDLNGICMRWPDGFVAAFADRGAAALVRYKIEANGTLNGIWAEQQHDGVGTDVLTPERLTSSGAAAAPASTSPVGAGGTEPPSTSPGSENKMGPGGMEPSSSSISHGHAHHQAP